jgi:integrase
MKGQPQPFFWRKRQQWYLNLGGKRHRLGPDREAAFRRYHEIMASAGDTQAPPGGAATASAYTPDTPVLRVLDDFLVWARDRANPRTYRCYLLPVRSFAKSLDPALPLRQLAPYHLQHWLDSRPSWSDGGRRAATVAARRPFARAMKLGLYPSNPLSGFPLPPAGRREFFLTPEAYAAWLPHVKSPPLRALVEFTWHTGCRPQEALRITAAHVDFHGRTVTLPKALAKGKRRPRVILLNDPAVLILRTLPYTEGPLFRNSKGSPWTAFSVSSALGFVRERQGLAVLGGLGWEPDAAEARRLAKAKGLPTWRVTKLMRVKEARRHARKVCLYTLRHSFCTRGLVAGLSTVTVAELMGHKDATMVARVYQHLDMHHDHLRRELDRLG